MHASRIQWSIADERIDREGKVLFPVLESSPCWQTMLRKSYHGTEDRIHPSRSCHRSAMTVMQIVAESTDLSGTVAAVLVFEVMCFCGFRDRKALEIGGHEAAHFVCRTASPADEILSLLPRSLVLVKDMRCRRSGCRLLSSSAFWFVHGSGAGLIRALRQENTPYLDAVLIVYYSCDIVSNQGDHVDEAVGSDIWSIAIWCHVSNDLSQKSILTQCHLSFRIQKSFVEFDA